jgi:hypothetical protein
MKVRKLQFLDHKVFIGDTVRPGGGVDETTHDIRPFGNGFWLLEHRRSGRAYLVHASLAVAEVYLAAEDEAPTKKGKAA